MDQRDGSRLARRRSHLLGPDVGATDAQRGIAWYDDGFAERHLILRREQELLRLETYTLFKDDSGRSHYYMVEQFRRE